MIVICEQDYIALKERIKKELLEEQRAKPENLQTIRRREQSAIFNRVFPESMFPSDAANRRYKIQSALNSLTNALRPHERRTLNGIVLRQNDYNAWVCSELELDYALKTYEALCTAAREIYREDVILGESGNV